MEGQSAVCHNAGTKLRIAYIVAHDTSSLDGVTKKIASQVKAWSEFGNDVLLLNIHPASNAPQLKARYFPFRSSLWRRVAPANALIDSLNEFNPDVVYLRYDGWTRGYETVARRFPTVIEVNSNVRAELQLSFRRAPNARKALALVSWRLLDPRLLKQLAGVVAVTDEIGAYYRDHTPTEIVPNGIELAAYADFKRDPTPPDRTALLFLGTGGYTWHGIDIIADIARRLPFYDFHIVGENGPSSGNLFYHGYLSQDRYQAVMKTVSICIGTLALHRKDMNEACPLKTREYLASGFPVIIGYQDTSFLKTQPDFLFTVDCRDPCRFDFEGLINFIEINKTRVVKHEELFAIESSHLEARRLRFFDRIAGNKFQLKENTAALT